MYKKMDKSLWLGRVDKEDKKFGKRWHEKIKNLDYPYNKKEGIAFLGFDCDLGVKRNKGRVGSSKGSDELKKAMGSFAYHLKNRKLYDAGKIIASEDLDKSQKLLAKHIKNLLEKKHFPIVIGGGHEIAYASFMGLHDFLNKKEDIAIINFDAHFDLRFNKLGTSGTPFAQCSSLCKQDKTNFSYLCLGVSEASNTQALFKKAKELNVKFIYDTNFIISNLKKIKNKIDKFLKTQENIYITIDTDCFYSYQVPAVSSPASRGIDLVLVYEVLKYIFNTYKRKVKLVDFAEFNPKYDINDIGKKSVSRLIYDIASLANNHL
ncbi:MAG: formimidoylglutamase [Arcobacter sp.]|nr:formimidoylglutamase [Arcobacter sp.]